MVWVLLLMDILKGQTLQEIIEEYGHDLVGSKVGVEKFPLLVKLINSREKLFVPSSSRRWICYEEWKWVRKDGSVVCYRCKPNAKLIVGTKNCTKKEFKKAIEENRTEDYLFKCNRCKKVMHFYK